MKKGIAIVVLIGMSLAARSQADSSDTKSASDTAVKQTDTIRIGNILIIRDLSGGNDKTTVYHSHKKYKPSNLVTNWGIVDLGISQLNDRTNYPNSIASGYLPAGANEDWFNQRSLKSTNISIWILMQRLNMISHVVNLKYGVGVEFNNYKYTENILFQKNRHADGHHG